MSKPTTAGILEWLRASAADPMAAEPEDGYVFRLAADRLEAAEAKLRDVGELCGRAKCTAVPTTSNQNHEQMGIVYVVKRNDLDAIINRGDV